MKYVTLMILTLGLLVGCESTVVTTTETDFSDGDLAENQDVDQVEGADQTEVEEPELEQVETDPDEDVDCRQSDLGCSGDWTTLCSGGIWVRVTDCRMVGMICETGICVPGQADGDGEHLTETDREETACSGEPCCHNHTWLPENSDCILEKNLPECMASQCSADHQCLPTLLPGFCYIDDFCQADGKEHPADSCLICDGSIHQWIEKEEGDICRDDGDLCNGVNTCRNGVCVQVVESVVCTSLDACHKAGVCDPGTGQCSNPPQEDGVACGTEDQCIGGVCQDCFNDAGCADLVDDGNPCSEVTCNTPTHQCRHKLDAHMGQPCGDTINTTCNRPDTCNAQGVCLPNFEDSSTACDDGNLCTYGDHCNSYGSCVAGNTLSCSNDPGPCGAQRACNGTSACTVSYSGTSTSCNDSDACTTSDHCDGEGACTGTLNTCNDHGSCDNGSCECTVEFTGAECDQCTPGTLGSYPYCFLPSTSFCLTSQCFRVPPTNQTACYDNAASATCPGVAGSMGCGTTDFCGQDAQYPDPPRQFTCYNAEGIATDCSTLIPVADNEVVVDSLTGMMWQRKIIGKISWQNAVDSCSDLVYGGYSDWRLPNPIELQSMVDDGTYSPAIDSMAFRGTAASYYWTSATHQTDSDSARYVDFTTGYMSFYRKTQGSYVRCVRGGDVGSTEGTFNPYVVSGENEQVVIHKTTGLIWQKSFTTNKTWSEAMAYCESLNYAEYSDWRLPNKKELVSLQNYEFISPCSDFPNMPAARFWSSSTYLLDPANGWNVGFSGGDVYFGSKTALYYARCVRGGP